MIKIKISKKDNIINKIEFTGHAMYEDYGKDIVCAAASAMLIITVNAIKEFDDDAIKYEEQNSEVILINIKKDEITNKLLINLEKMLIDLEKEYKKNIKIN